MVKKFVIFSIQLIIIHQIQYNFHQNNKHFSITMSKSAVFPTISELLAIGSCFGCLQFSALCFRCA